MFSLSYLRIGLLLIAFYYGSTMAAQQTMHPHLGPIAKNLENPCYAAEAQKRITLVSGNLKSSTTREPMLLANFWIPELGIGTCSDFNGDFELVMPVGSIYSDSVTLIVSHIGFETYTKRLAVKDFPITK